MYARLDKHLTHNETDIHWEAREILRDIEGQPHLLTRIKLSGVYFPHRAREPFMVIGRVFSRFVEIADDSLSARGYFDAPLPETGTIKFGYGREVAFRFPGRFSRENVQRLDPIRLPNNVRLPHDR